MNKAANLNLLRRRLEKELKLFMERIGKKITLLHAFVASLMLLCYGVLRFNKLFLNNTLLGDERGYLDGFKLFLEEGFYVANVAGNSTLFNCVGYVFNLLLDTPIISLRVTSLFFGILAVLVSYFIIIRHTNLTKLYKFVALLTVLNIFIISSFIFLAINDLPLIVFGLLSVLFLLEYQKGEMGIRTFFLGFGVLIGLMMATRMVVVTYFPAYSIALYLVIRRKGGWKECLVNSQYFIVPLFLVISIFHFPSLIKNQSLSSHSKEMNVKDASWASLQYLSAIKSSNGELVGRKHVTLEETQQYVVAHGENSLPKTFLESIYFDPIFTIKEFVKDFVLLVKPMTRLIGLVFIAGIIGAIILFKREKKILPLGVMTSFSLVHMATIAFIIISYIEDRWMLGSFALIAIVLVEIVMKVSSIFEVKHKWKYDFLMVNGQFATLILMNLPYILKSLN